MEEIIIITAAAYQKQTEELLLYKMKGDKLKKKNYDLLTEIETLEAKLAETQKRLAAEKADNAEMAIALHRLNVRYQQLTEGQPAGSLVPVPDAEGSPASGDCADDEQELPY